MMPKLTPFGALLGVLLLPVICGCSRHESQLRAEGKREISGHVHIALSGQPKINLAQVTVIITDLDETAKNFKALQDKHPGSQASKLTVQDYQAALSPAVAGDKTDAEGKFKLVVPAKRPLLLCAFTVFSSPDNKLIPFCWMVRLNEALSKSSTSTRRTTSLMGRRSPI